MTEEGNYDADSSDVNSLKKGFNPIMETYRARNKMIEQMDLPSMPSSFIPYWNDSTESLNTLNQLKLIRVLGGENPVQTSFLGNAVVDKQLNFLKKSFVNVNNGYQQNDFMKQVYIITVALHHFGEKESTETQIMLCEISEVEKV